MLQLHTDTTTGIPKLLQTLGSDIIRKLLHITWKVKVQYYENVFVGT
jgi:hypothetical protein